MADEDSPAVGPTLADRLEDLFRDLRRPDGRPYSNVDVAKAVAAQGVEISAPYLWQLRTGRRDNPSMRHLQALAGFFGVDPSYFFGTGPAEAFAAELELVGALRRVGVRELALASAGLSEGTLQVLEHLVAHVRMLEGLPVEPVA